MTRKYKKEDLQEALKSVSSLLSKCRKAQTSVRVKSSQETLLVNRINGLQIAVELIENEINHEDLSKNVGC
ncbi:hypothetical protein GCM10011378_39600 [Hymenobacter glacieicola]|uniref:Uncharacterized protein n=1 Tax=Hymenobacter glacieicola TaxID=1562124 RepID=A0ABQ1X4K1_9BACT|nr:hypothetical protein GCM10011378_39600 [Hymenobacter glacieicola]